MLKMMIVYPLPKMAYTTLLFICVCILVYVSCGFEALKKGTAALLSAG